VLLFQCNGDFIGAKGAPAPSLFLALTVGKSPWRARSDSHLRRSRECVLPHRVGAMGGYSQRGRSVQSVHPGGL